MGARRPGLAPRQCTADRSIGEARRKRRSASRSGAARQNRGLEGSSMTMKWSMGLIALLALDAAAADAISEEKTWQQSFPVTSATPQLLVRNIWGNVTVRP